MTELYKYGLAVIQENRLLLCKAYTLNELILPGGVKEGCEDYIEGLLREINEELGSASILQVDTLKYISNYKAAAAGKSDTTVEIELYYGEVSGNLQASDEIEELIWFEEYDDRNRLSLIIKDYILDDLIDKGYLSWQK